MNTIELCSHCYNGHLPIYAPMLRAQGLSLIHHSGHKCKVAWSICYDEKDEAVVDVLSELEPALLARNVEIYRFASSVERLLQRSIGRNIVALSSGADCVWFCDCDYLFVGACLDAAISATAVSSDAIVYPYQVWVTSHPDGDSIIEKMQAKKELIADDLSKFYTRSENKAIGGIQIVSGELARSKGYLDGSKWQKPVSTVSRGSFMTASDVRYRGSIGKLQQHSIPGVHRIRHSCRAYGGTVVE